MSTLTTTPTTPPPPQTTTVVAPLVTTPVSISPPSTIVLPIPTTPVASPFVNPPNPVYGDVPKWGQIFWIGQWTTELRYMFVGTANLAIGAEVTIGGTGVKPEGKLTVTEEFSRPTPTGAWTRDSLGLSYKLVTINATQTEAKREQVSTQTAFLGGLGSKMGSETTTTLKQQPHRVRNVEKDRAGSRGQHAHLASEPRLTTRHDGSQPPTLAFLARCGLTDRVQKLHGAN